MQILSVDEWAKNNKVSRRKAYRWVKAGLLPTAKRKVEMVGVPADITKEDIGKG